MEWLLTAREYENRVYRTGIFLWQGGLERDEVPDYAKHEPALLLRRNLFHDAHGGKALGSAMRRRRRIGRFVDEHP